MISPDLHSPFKLGSQPTMGGENFMALTYKVGVEVIDTPTPAMVYLKLSWWQKLKILLTCPLSTLWPTFKSLRG